MLLAEVCEKPPRAKLVVARRDDSLVARAGQDLGDVIRAKVFAHTQHARQYLLANDKCILHHLKLAEANVARVARSISPRLTEVIEQTGVAASNGLGVAVDFFEPRGGCSLSFARVALIE